MNSQADLESILGEKWREASIFPDVLTGLEEYNVGSLKDGEKKLPDEAKTELDDFIVECNDIFRQNDSNYRARLIIDKGGLPKIFIVGQIGDDTMYHIIQHFLVYNDRDGSRVVAWSPDEVGFVGKSGKVFSISKAIKNEGGEEEESDFLFIEVAGRKYGGNMQVTSGESGSDLDTINPVPETPEQLAAYMHEVGHMLRKRCGNQEAASAAYRDFKRASETGNPYSKTKLTPYKTRVIKSKEERGAWAIGLALLKEGGRAIGLECASTRVLQQMLQIAEKSLATYDTVPYTFIEHPEDEEIPAFSRRRRKDAKALHREIERAGRKYDELLSFDQHTGENLASNPKELLRRMKHERK
jgi:hypothetical protein